MVRSDAIENELFFRSSASAESAAVRLAQGLADAEEGARVSIFLRDASLARQFVVPSLRLVHQSVRAAPGSSAPFDASALTKTPDAEG